MTMRSVLLVAVLFSVAVAAAPASVHAQTPPDIVTLTNGGMLRGTIIENMPGDHVTIQLPTGETRRFASAEVATAGPAQQASQSQAPVMGAPTTPTTPTTQTAIPPAPYTQGQPLAVTPVVPTVNLHVTANVPRITLQQLTGSASITVWTGRGYGTGLVESYAPICTAPCDVRIPPGTYTLGLSQGEGHSQRADHSMYTFQRDSSLQLEYQSREGLRIVGWVIFSLATVGYLIGALAPIGSDDFLPIFLGTTIGYVVLSIVSLVFIMFRDHADIRQLNPDGSVSF